MHDTGLLMLPYCIYIANIANIFFHIAKVLLWNLVLVLVLPILFWNISIGNLLTNYNYC